MMVTAEQSAKLKQRFKAWFNYNGYNSAMSAKLSTLSEKYPIEYGEACQEWEADNPDKLDD